jgi:thiamine-phosphate pyrophosphorylase
MKEAKARFLESPTRIYCFAETLKDCATLLNAGAKIIQFRNKHADDQVFRDMAREMLALTRRHEDCVLIVNDRVPIAVELGVDGIHIGQGDGDHRSIISGVPPWMIVGVSARYPELAQEAAEAGATYVGAGAVFPSSTKPDAPVIGIEGLRAVVERVAVPVVAIGGITGENIQEVLDAGARYCAVISAVNLAEDAAGAYRLLSAATCHRNGR